MDVIDDIAKGAYYGILPAAIWGVASEGAPAFAHLHRFIVIGAVAGGALTLGLSIVLSALPLRE